MLNWIHVSTRPPILPAALRVGLVAWYNAEKIRLNDGDRVMLWPDSSGNGNDLVQTTTTFAPFFRRQAVNRRNVLEFDSAGESMFTNGIIDLPLWTIAAAANPNSPQISSVLVNELYEATSGVSGEPRMLQYSLGFGSTDQLDTRLNAGYYDLSLHWQTSRAPSGATPSGQAVFAGTRTATQVTAYKNGVAYTPTTVSGGPASHAPLAISRGKNPTGGPFVASRFYIGTIGEILVYNRALSQDEITGVTQYLAGRFAQAL